MRLFPPPLEIDAKEGFAPEKDIFKRARIGEGLTKLLSSTSDPLVLALNGAWGTGKSTFLRMWAGELRKAGFPVIEFDAFAHDYIADAFEALAGEILDVAKQLKPAEENKIKKAAITAGKYLIKIGTAVGVRAATAGLMSVAELGEVVDDAKDAVGDTADKLVEKALESRQVQRDALDAFRSALSELPTLLGAPDKPLVFIIDELDRCRPSFSLELLERIKHFFAVPNIHFVLGVQIQQLENSVRVAYGDGMDAALYLQKFISIQVELDLQERFLGNMPVVRYLSHLQQQMDVPLHGTMEELGKLCAHLNVSLRSAEKIMSILALAIAHCGDERRAGVSSYLAGLTVMKVLAPELYSKAKRATLTYKEAADFFDLQRAKQDRDEWPHDGFVTWWRYGLDPTLDRKEVENIDRFMPRTSDRRRHIQDTANEALERFSYLR